MIEQKWQDKMKALGLYGLMVHADSIEKLIDIPSLIQWEEEVRAERGLKNRLKLAKLGEFKSIADFDWKFPTKCDRLQIEEYLKADFVREAMNLVILGPNGAGKSMIACNIAYQAVLGGHTALFVKASQMLNDLESQGGTHDLNRRLKYYSTPELLIADEIGFLSYSNAHADLLFEIIARRYEKKSTIVTTNKAFVEWDQIFPNASCVVSLIDRIIHRSDMIHIEVPYSYRLKEAKERDVKRQKSKNKKSHLPLAVVDNEKNTQETETVLEQTPDEPCHNTIKECE